MSVEAFSKYPLIGYFNASNRHYGKKIKNIAIRLMISVIQLVKGDIISVDILTHEKRAAKFIEFYTYKRNIYNNFLPIFYLHNVVFIFIIAFAVFHIPIDGYELVIVYLYMYITVYFYILYISNITIFNL